MAPHEQTTLQNYDFATGHSEDQETLENLPGAPPGDPHKRTPRKQTSGIRPKTKNWRIAPRVSLGGPQWDYPEKCLVGLPWGSHLWTLLGYLPMFSLWPVVWVTRVNATEWSTTL